jgi:hypothetical protein
MALTRTLSIALALRLSLVCGATSVRAQERLEIRPSQPSVEAGGSVELSVVSVATGYGTRQVTALAALIASCGAVERDGVFRAPLVLQDKACRVTALYTTPAGRLLRAVTWVRVIAPRAEQVKPPPPVDTVAAVPRPGRTRKTTGSKSE